LLGISVQGFSKGPDGGRDAKFVGTAEIFPSKSAPWNGAIIIQAKHTNGYNKKFSESDFFSNAGKNTVISNEIPRIKKLKGSKQLDHYMLFANRGLAANAESEIREYISTQCSMPVESIYLCGIEQLEIFLKNFPEVPKLANLDPIDSPLIVSPDDLAEVVQAFALNKNTVQEFLDDPPTLRISFERKNALNNMSAEYAKAQQRNYLKETAQIRTFLAAPENLGLLRLYETVTDEFNFKIIAKRKNYQSFDEVMNYLIDLLFNRDPVLCQHKKLTRTMLFYMYWNCDIGETNDAETD
jgi:hypothetical protein